jgi:predicted nucleotidyltransferase
MKKQKMNKEIEKMKPKIIEVLKKNNVKRAGIFGSYARGEQKKNSDVDIIVEFDGSLFDFVGLKLELEKRLKKKVDLVEYAAIKPRIKNYILSDEVKMI